jgi:outer membrane protein assembly factor BamB
VARKNRQGWGQPAIVGDSIYICWTTDLHGTGEVVACFAAKDGAERWRYAYETPPYWKRNIGWAKGGVRATPCVSGGHLFTLGPGGHLHCLDRATGRVVWAQDLYTRWSFSGEKGFSFSPLVVDGKLIVWFGDNSYAMDDPDKKLQVVCEALDPATGKALWTFLEPHLPGSLMGEGQTPASHDRRRRALPAHLGKLPAQGPARERWPRALEIRLPAPGTRGTSPPTPLVVGRFIVNLPDCDWMHVVEFDRETSGATAKILWRKDHATYTAVHQFREYDGFLYGFTGHQPGESDVIASGAHLALTCIDLVTGDVRWKEPGFRTGTSHLLADGLLFVRCYQTLRLVEATPDGYRQRGEVHTHDVWKPTLNITDIVCPVLSRGRLYVRTPEELSATTWRCIERGASHDRQAPVSK